jgi:replication factor C large subunit
MQEQYDLYEVPSLGGILGNDDAIARLEGFAGSTEEGKSSIPLLVFGPPGTGKTAAVHMLARKYRWNIVEMNASDYRDKEAIERRLTAASTSRTLFHKRNLILLDEIDELAARFDRGAGAAISNLIANSKSPIIFIANDMWDKSISFLRGKVEPVEFKKLAPPTVARVISNLCKRLSIEISEEAKDIIANRSNGDARSAINDVSVVMGSNDEVIEVIGLRDRKVDIFEMLDKIFLTSASRALGAQMRAISNTDLTNEMLINWIDENIPRRYTRVDEMRRAFEALAYASVFMARAARSQYYTYWRYMNVLMLSGVALAKSGYPDTRSRYAFPKFIKELSASKTERKEEAEIAEKLQRYFHSSVDDIGKREMRMLAQIARRAREKGATKGEIEEEFMSRFQLEGKEVECLMNS